MWIHVISAVVGISVWISVVSVVGELYLRRFAAEQLAVVSDERNLAYQHDARLGWFPVPGSDRLLQGHRQVRVRHNSRGFRDREHGNKVKPRIAIVGDSFVWGYDVERDERFTEHLQRRLPDWDVVNLGVSGYGTDQELLLLQDQFDHYEPDAVVLVICSDNDAMDNSSNVVYGGYHKPYYVLKEGRLSLHGMPVRKTLHHYAAQYPGLFASYLVRATVLATFGRPLEPVELDDPSEALLREMRDFVEQRGATFGIGVQGKETRFLDFARAEGIPAVGLWTEDHYPDNGQHWTPEGHIFVADRLYELVLASGIVEFGGGFALARSDL